MGIGVFNDDFGGSGRSINVDMPSPDDKEYEAYVAAEAGSEFVMGRAEWARDVFDDANAWALDVAERVARSVGLSSCRKGRFEGDRVGFDKDLTGVAEGTVFDVGWRSWGDDVVLAIGPSAEFEDFARFPSDNAGYALASRGRLPDALKADYDATLSDFETLMRLSLLRGGLATAVPTSGYTQARDVLPPDAEDRIAALTASVADGIRRISRDPALAIAAATGEERVTLAAAVLSYSGDDVDPSDLPRVTVATVDGTGTVATWDPRDADNSLLSNLTPPQALKPRLASLALSGDGLAGIPHDPETKGWYASRTRDGILLSPEQYAQASGAACTVTWRDDDADTSGSYLLHEGPAPAPTC